MDAGREPEDEQRDALADGPDGVGHALGEHA